MELEEAVYPCSFCGQPHNLEGLLTMESLRICERCKPYFVQRLREDGAIPSALDIARVGFRTAGLIIDSVIFSLGNMLLVWFVQWVLGLFGLGQLSDVPSVALPLILALVYNIVPVARYGGTPGKLIVGTVIVRPDGQPITWRRATGRYFARLLSYWTVGIGFLLAEFDAERRTLHDRIADTRVIMKRSRRPWHPVP